MNPTFLVLAIGDELMEGRHVDRNSAAISRHLVQLGFEPREHVTLPDDEDLLEARLMALAPTVDLIVSTGGLGPTLDDVTRSAFARAGGRPLERNVDVESALIRFFAELGREMAPTNRRQADFPEGARVLANPHGTAPGFATHIGTTLCLVMPGPPREMLPMLEGPATAALVEAGLVQGAPKRQSFYLAALSESAFAQTVADAGNWMAAGSDPRMGVTAADGVLAVEMVARHLTPASEAKLVERAAAFRLLFAESIYSETDKRIERVLVQRLIERGITLALAESCTGGGVAAMVCSVPGASAIFEQGWVTYSDRAKTAQLGVPVELLQVHGAVSAPIVEAMARGLHAATGARLCLSISGVAGPDGGSESKPVGLVWFGLAIDGVVESFERRFPPVGRERIQTFARHTGIGALLAAIERLSG